MQKKNQRKRRQLALQTTLSPRIKKISTHAMDAEQQRVRERRGAAAAGCRLGRLQADG